MHNNKTFACCCATLLVVLLSILMISSRDALVFGKFIINNKKVMPTITFEELKKLLPKEDLSKLKAEALINTVSIYCSSSASSTSKYYLKETSTSFTYTFGNYDFDKAIAVGILYDGYSPVLNNQTDAVDGWMRLWVSTFTNVNRESSGVDACYKSEINRQYAAGMVEGLLTQPQIYNFFQNQYSNWKFAKNNVDLKAKFGDNNEWVKSHERFRSSQQQGRNSSNYYFPSALVAYMQDNYNWLNQQVASNPTSNYWKQVGGTLTQFNGLVQGYTIRAEQEKNEVYGSLNWLDLYFLQAAGDMETLETAIKDPSTTTRSRNNNNNNGIVLPDEETMTDCSALIKITPDCLNLFAGHTTWRGYNIINKMYKVYSLLLNNVASKTVSFASSPSFLSSKDDFYVTENGLVTMETTNDVFNETLFQYITPKSVLCWVRSIVANRLATTSKEWVYYFGLYNSGTYNNQWMALDYKNFKPGVCHLPKDSFWILEQIPGSVMTRDVTDVLNKQSFWSSFNIPYFEHIYNISGYQQAKQKFGNDYDYNLCSRALIFKREQAKIGADRSKPVDYKDFGRVLQFNEWKTDPYSLGDPSKAVSSRYDLRDLRFAAFGGIDTKVTDYVKNLKHTSMWGICGPTHQDESQTPPFTWTDKFKATHLGQPQTYNFDWVDLEDVDSFYSSLSQKSKRRN
ncbi:laminin A family protein [Naegleria gruberi]|uniref:Phospholipase B-like n=1 Tax=Naegleria gruberi TaxID=5762 RepID=D2V7M1_NAEGR|nr:laminin A family protein [Naegleria gruberi]EFC47273.1 laminin A family protein [Naegleria gruberi]|eukprot:XP_002680017.1 laminin A family protein [Naegleria gruberi strain NEG-M]